MKEQPLYGGESLEYIIGRLARCKIDEVGVENLNKENLLAMGIKDNTNISTILACRKNFKINLEGESINIKIRCDFYIVADFLDEPIQLWNNDVTLVGRKQIQDVPEDIVKDQLLFEVSAGSIVVSMVSISSNTIINIQLMNMIHQFSNMMK